MMNDEKSVLGLATVRRNRGITLEQISQATKIGVRSLEAIETGEFRRLPGGIYSTSYIRQYARAIDYPEDDILDVYRRHMASQAVASPPSRDKEVHGGGFRAAHTPASS
jgi:cytoskeletal protein RodZ